MDYDGLYKDLTAMSQEASHRAAMCMEFDVDHAMILLGFAAECEGFASNLFIRGWGGY